MFGNGEHLFAARREKTRRTLPELMFAAPEMHKKRFDNYERGRYTLVEIPMTTTEENRRLKISLFLKKQHAARPKAERVEIGRRLGLARVAKQTPEERSESARRAVRERWRLHFERTKGEAA